MMEEDVREENYNPINQLKLNILLLQISWKHMISKQRSNPFLELFQEPIYLSWLVFLLKKIFF